MSPVLSDLSVVLAGACSLLVIATLVGETWRARASDPSSRQSVETYLTRVRSWWGMTILTSLALLLGKGALILLFAFISFAALRELLTLTAKDKGDHWALVAAFYVMLPGQYALIWFELDGIFAIFIPVYAYLLLPILSALRGSAVGYLKRISETQWALMVSVYCASHVPALMVLEIDGFEGRNVLLIAFLVLVVQLGDLADYFVGRRYGKRLIASQISPRRWTGAGVGCLVAMATGGVLGLLLPFGPLGAAAMAFVVFWVGVGGSLVLKAIKKNLGVKDMGHLIPGQGGFLDQMDSVFFAAPVFFHLTRFFWGS